MAKVTYASTKGLSLFGTEKGAWMADTDTASLVGGQLITDGGFTAACGVYWNCGTGWSIGSGVATKTPGVSSSLTQSVSTTAGKAYNVTITISGATGGTVTPYFNSGYAGDSVALGNGANQIQTIIDNTGSNLLYLDASAAFDGNVDDVSLYPAEPDLSAYNNGMSVYGTLTRSVVAAGADLVGYSGWSGANFLFRAPDVDYAFGTGDFFYGGWIKETPNTVTEKILEQRQNGVNQGWIHCEVHSSGVLRFGTHDGTTDHNLDSPAVYDDSIYHFVCFVKRSGTKHLYVDGVEVASDTPSTNNTMTNTAAVLSIGQGVDGGSPLTNGSLALWRTGAFAPTANQIRSIYNSEKWMFKPYAKYRQVGQAYDLDIRYRALDRSITAIKNKSISLSGYTETVNQRFDTTWNINTIPILRTNGDLDEYRIFLESVLEGQTFVFDPYGTIAVPDELKTVYLESDSYSESREASSEYYTLNFNLREY